MITLCWIITGCLMLEIAILSGLRVPSSIAAALLAVAFTLGWGPPPQTGAHFVAHQRGTDVHSSACFSVRYAIEAGEDLRPFRNLQDAFDSGLKPHRCLDGYLRNRQSKYTASAPNAEPTKNVTTYHIPPPADSSTD